MKVEILAQENHRINSHALEFDHLPLSSEEDSENSFRFYTKDGRYWVINGEFAFSNEHSRVPNGFNMHEFMDELSRREQRLGINPEEEAHNGVVDLIWKNWGKLWEYFQPNICYKVDPQCFREVHLSRPDSEKKSGQPDLVGIGPNGSVNIIEVGALGTSASRRLKKRKMTLYETRFREIFGDNLTMHSFVIFYKQIAEGYIASFQSPEILENK